MILEKKQGSGSNETAGKEATHVRPQILPSKDMTSYFIFPSHLCGPGGHINQTVLHHLINPNPRLTRSTSKKQSQHQQYFGSKDVYPFSVYMRNTQVKTTNEEINIT